MDSIGIHSLKSILKETLPETYRLLKMANLTVHPNVRKITLHGSRGPAGGYREDSDIDLCLVTDVDTQSMDEGQSGYILREVLQTTLKGSQCSVELDLAAVFDSMRCGLSCFNISDYDKLKCKRERNGCIGIFKIQKGFKGFVPPITTVSKMYPYITIWQR